MKRRPVNKVVTWLSDEISIDQKSSITFRHYEKFQFNDLIAEIGDFVLVSNADSAEPDTEEGCDAARIVALYEDTTNSSDPFRAKVQWYSRPEDLPKSSLSNTEPIEFLDREVLEDYRPFDTDVSIETFFKKCSILLTFTRDIDVRTSPYNYVCRYRLKPVNKRKVHLEPVLEEERKALQLLSTPAKTTPSRTPKTPSSLVKCMSRVSISEQKNWSVTKNDGTKLLLKRAILADKIDKDSPKKVTPKPTPTKTITPRSTKRLTSNNIEQVLSLELRENSDDELPTLIIRQHVPSTPKRKTSIAKNSDDTPRKMLQFEDDEKETPSKRSGRTKTSVNYCEPELSPVKKTPLRTRAARASISQIENVTPVKRTPRKSIRKISEDSEDDFVPAPKTPKTPRTPKGPRTPRATPGKTPKRRIITSELTPTLQSRAHSIDDNNDLKKDSSLPGREMQLEEILSFVRSKLLDGTSGCMYISGVPGTGKTATVWSALQTLKEEVDLPEFQLVEVNGMRIAEPRQAYVQIYKQLTGKSVVWEQACSLLDKRFTNPGPRRTPTVLLVDELDALCTRRQDVLYSIMEWAAHNSARLTVLAVANTMDLPERALAARVASRLGLTRLTFPPYTHSQMQTIVTTRLKGNVTADAVQLIARVASRLGLTRLTFPPYTDSQLQTIVTTRLKGNVTADAVQLIARLGLTRLTFPPYTHSQLQTIVTTRLKGNVTADAVQLIARKVAAVSGDARRAIALCSRALELAGPSGAGLAQVQQALAEAASGAAWKGIPLGS
ncbi:ATPase family associated with various cellular activities (AAA) domain-containing protein [Phthorimaea operculella]|nr:ATPase family associated with various cellular activities (AAA) domain-containing protein [Phthorimaea operculella]